VGRRSPEAFGIESELHMQSNKKQNILGSIVMFIVSIYFISVSVMSCYYWYRDVKLNDGFVRAVFWSPVVGTFKAMHWPYYAFFEKDSKDDAPRSVAHRA
jgi:hypothetical protein